MSDAIRGGELVDERRESASIEWAVDRRLEPITRPRDMIEPRMLLEIGCGLELELTEPVEIRAQRVRLVERPGDNLVRLRKRVPDCGGAEVIDRASADEHECHDRNGGDGRTCCKPSPSPKSLALIEV